jgi:hypothetical protein
MADRLVVSLRGRTLPARGPSEEQLRVVAGIVKRAVALGGRVIAWQPSAFAFDFDPEAVDEIIELLTAQPLPPGYNAGVAQGSVDVVLDAGYEVALAAGPALSLAQALSRVARNGEVLLHPSLEGVESRALLTLGSRIGVMGRERVRGMRLDLRYPLRRLAVGAMSQLTHEVALEGAPDPQELSVLPGKLTLLIAPHGHGGSRYLSALAACRTDSSALFVGPHPIGEPLGALRRAFLRATAQHPDAAQLFRSAGPSLGQLLGGRGLSIDASAALIMEWLRGTSDPDAAGLVVVDDVVEVDRDTLEAIGRAAAQGSVAVVARVARPRRLPRALDLIPRAGSVELAPLSTPASERLLNALAQGSLDERAVKRWAKRGGSTPLALFEALIEGVEGGELVSQAERLVPRLRLAGRGRTQRAEHWIARRMGLLDPDSRTWLETIALLGGEVELRELDALGAEARLTKLTASDALVALSERHWLRESGPGLCALPSRTHRDAILSQIDEKRLRALHHAASTSLAESPRPLTQASAALHAVLSGNVGKAALLAVRAAASARAAGLIATAEALEAFAHSGEQSALAHRGLAGRWNWDAPEPISVAPEGAAVFIPDSNVDSIPVEVAEASDAEAMSGPISGPEPPGIDVDVDEMVPVSVDEEADDEGDRPTLTSDHLTAVSQADEPVPITPRSAAPPAPDDDELPPRSGRVRPSHRVPFDSEPVTGAPAWAAEALRRGDLPALDALVSEMREQHPGSLIADRLEALAELRRGDPVAALRILRSARERAESLDARERGRVALALAIALSARGHAHDALLEALEALACAREAQDASGARACARFIASLTRAADEPDLAQRWDEQGIARKSS